MKFIVIEGGLYQIFEEDMKRINEAKGTELDIILATIEVNYVPIQTTIISYNYL